MCVLTTKNQNGCARYRLPNCGSQACGKYCSYHGKVEVQIATYFRLSNFYPRLAFCQSYQE